MINPLSKTPFLLLLLPLLAGIVCQYYLDIHMWSITFCLIGIALMLLSYFVSPDKYYQFRWLSGAGVCLSLFGLATMLTHIQEQKSDYEFTDDWLTSKAKVISNVKPKPKSDAYELELTDSRKKVIAYFEQDSTQVSLLPGDVILLKTKIQAFRNRGYNPKFDYVQYMHNKGFVGSIYVSSTHWKKVGESFSLTSYSLLIRQKLLDVCQSFDLKPNELGILSALTLGYKETLSEDIVQSFRATGTVHVLSISGLHVAIVYAFILFLLRPIRNHSRLGRFKPLIVILLLFVYAFISGLSPSVVRATTMLSIYCIANLFNRRKHSLHTLYIAAFFMLIVNPLQLFDIGFQLSFVSVLGILYFYSYLHGLFVLDNKVIRWVWSAFSLSVVAQLSTLPLCLFYFGTFPTYFFIANILVVPAITILLYSGLALILVGGINFLLSNNISVMLDVVLHFVKSVVWLLTIVLQWIENLPYSNINDLYLSVPEVFLLLITLGTIAVCLVGKRVQLLNISLVTSVLLIVFSICY